MDEGVANLILFNNVRMLPFHILLPRYVVLHVANQHTMPATKDNMLPDESDTKNILPSNPSC
jgi:hypothetical protein